jgi:hypothetical protein
MVNFGVNESKASSALRGGRDGIGGLLGEYGRTKSSWYKSSISFSSRL